MNQASNQMHETWPVEDLVCHRGDISLLGQILGQSEDWLEARSVVDVNNPFMAQGGVPAWVGIEYMAQAVAAWAGVQARGQGEPVRVGFLLGSRRYESSVGVFHEGSTLRTRVDLMMMDESGVGVFDCRIVGRNPRGEAFTATARLKVFQPDNYDDLLTVRT